MSAVTGSVRTWGLGPFPADERLIIWFIPSSAAFTTVSAFPGRRVWVEPDSNGFFSVDLAPTLDLSPEVWYYIRFEWFERHPIEGWVKKGSSDVEGKLRVPSAGGTIGDLIQAAPPPGVIVAGRGKPGPHVKNVIYLDNSGMKTGLYVPAGSVGIA